LKCDTQGAGFCDSDGCISGYTSLSNSYVCVKCLNGCTSCDSSDFTICLACSDGTYLSNGLCVPCSIGCLSCSSQTTCSKCSQTYSLSNGVCYLIPDLPCLQTNIDGVCTNCSKSYQLISSVCQLVESSVCTNDCT
jgi:proprotein convertase subtilisin/kexin type 5